MLYAHIVRIQVGERRNFIEPVNERIFVDKELLRSAHIVAARCAELHHRLAKVGVLFIVMHAKQRMSRGRIIILQSR